MRVREIESLWTYQGYYYICYTPHATSACTCMHAYVRVIHMHMHTPVGLLRLRRSDTPPPQAVVRRRVE